MGGPCAAQSPRGIHVAHRRACTRWDFEQRLDAVEWWGHAPVTRDYVRLWLQGASGGFEAIA